MAKKRKFIYTNFEDEVFRRRVFVCYGNLKGWRRFLRQHRVEKWCVDSCAGQVCDLPMEKWDRESLRWIGMYFNTRKNLKREIDRCDLNLHGLIAHEVCHANFRSMYYAGVDGSGAGTDETHAHYTDFLTRSVLRALKGFAGYAE